MNFRLECPWCGGPLPGAPGQFIKCMHCRSMIHWGGATPFRTKREADADVLTRHEVELAIRDQKKRTEFRLARQQKLRRRMRKLAARKRKGIVKDFGLSCLQYLLWLPNNLINQTLARTALYFPGLLAIVGPGTAECLVGLAAGKKACISLRRVRQVSRVVASCLAEFPGKLCLDGLCTLGPEVAEELARHRGMLSINGIDRLSVEEAKAFVKHSKMTCAVSLLGVVEVPPRVAVELARFRGDLMVHPNVAVSLAEVRRWNERAGRKTSPKASSNFRYDTPNASGEVTASKLAWDQAFKIVQRARGELKLNSLQAITPDVARVLADFEGLLEMNGLKKIGPDVAEELARHKGDLYLNGVRVISAEAAKSLAGHSGGIELNGVLSLDREAALELAQLPYWLSLCGVRWLGEGVAECFGARLGDTQIDGVVNIDKLVASKLADHRHWLSLNGIRKLEADVCSELARFRGEMLWLLGLIDTDAVSRRSLVRNPAIVLSGKFLRRREAVLKLS